MRTPYIKTRESEVNIVVVEELFSSTSFRRWLLKKLNLSGSYKFIGAWKSFLGKYGECDIAVEFIAKKQRTMLLIENKIDSPAQFMQAERYHETGKGLIKNEGYTHYTTILLSPKTYLKDGAFNEGYEHKLSYEELLAFFEKQGNSARMRFKRMVVKNGIERARTGYQRTTDENTDKFYQYYEQLARKIFPELEYRKPKEIASGNSWIYLHPKVLPSYITIVHKGTRGYVDLQMRDGNAQQIIAQHKKELKKNMSVHQTGKSASIRIMVPALPGLEKITKPQTHQRKVIKALRAARELLNWWLQYYKTKPNWK